MAKEQNAVAVEVEAPVKEVSKTDLYKEHLQKIISARVGKTISKEKAWAIFKDLIHGTVEFVFNTEDNVLPLAGVGTFKILKTVARGKKAGLDAEGNPIPGAKAYEFVPRAKMYFSSSVDKGLEQRYGLADYGLEVKSYGLYAKDTETVAEGTVVGEKVETKSDEL